MKIYKSYNFSPSVQKMGNNGLDSDGKFEAITTIGKNFDSEFKEQKFLSGKYFESEEEALVEADKFAKWLIDNEKISF